MRLASYNIENLFERPVAMNKASWEDGRAILEAFQTISNLLAKDSYSAADKAKILKLLKQDGITNQNSVGRNFVLRDLRKGFFHKPRNGALTIRASGRGDWLGWVELRKEEVKDTAVANTARIIDLLHADILAVIEAENRISLRQFNSTVIPGIASDGHYAGMAFRHVMLIDGNDDRGIDVGLMTGPDYPIETIRSHIDDAFGGFDPVFSRDCAQYGVTLPGGETLWLLVNHFKSQGYGDRGAAHKKRRAQAGRVKQIYDGLRKSGAKYIAVLGDLNAVPEHDSLAPLLDGDLRDIGEHPGFIANANGKRGTFGACNRSNKLDYILLSPALWKRVIDAGVERRGIWAGTKGNMFDPIAEIRSARDAASDHAAIWVDLDL